ncbi:SAM-dependent methyltransferase [Cesiribacter andamanensis]|uniref:Ribosomal RNA small subunit methyltransferase I n=1 Tax=Cesiribacter andamanensis AMV16 TaxID=1279009 RepID=M7NZK0_9BACT|nr:SAM-dependent methyltransferase [Cesiribacter andamanensis]EMR03759.1 Ribosomal RNA small subunit methyltransferase I [Cesiribacter andamanensis AMV16]
MQTPKKGKLFLLPTPLADDTAAAVLPAQAMELFKSLRHYLCEEARTSRRFLSSLRLGLTIEELSIEELNKDTPDHQVPHLLQPLLDGHDMGILSEAGCPGVADPGARAVAQAHEKGIQVVPVVGPSSILLALMASGLDGQNFAFRGYLPVRNPERSHAIKSLEKGVRSGQTQLFMETPYRNNPLLKDLMAHCQPETMLCVAANLTGADEFIQTRSIKQWKQQLPDLHKQPAIFILGNTPSYKKSGNS